MGRDATPLQTSPRVFEHFLSPGSPGSHEVTVNIVSHAKRVQFSRAEHERQMFPSPLVSLTDDS